ncbi:hypothetical protein D9M70_401890 [compost metagenome]
MSCSCWASNSCRSSRRHCSVSAALARLLPVPSKNRPMRRVMAWRAGASSSSSSSSSSRPSGAGSPGSSRQARASSGATGARPTGATPDGECAAAGLWVVPITTLPEPATTTLPWLPCDPTTAAGRPLIRTLSISAPDSAPPQAEASPWRAAGRPSNSTSGEPWTNGLPPCPERGQAVGSPRRAAGLPDMPISLSAQREQQGCRNGRRSARENRDFRRKNHENGGDCAIFCAVFPRYGQTRRRYSAISQSSRQPLSPWASSPASHGSSSRSSSSRPHGGLAMARPEPARRLGSSGVWT